MSREWTYIALYFGVYIRSSSVLGHFASLYIVYSFFLHFSYIRIAVSSIYFMWLPIVHSCDIIIYMHYSCLLLSLVYGGEKAS